MTMSREQAARHRLANPVHSANRMRPVNRVHRVRRLAGNRVRPAPRVRNLRFGRVIMEYMEDSVREVVKFLSNVRAEEFLEQFSNLMCNFWQQGFHLSHVAHAEHLLRQHRALLVEFSNHLSPQGC